MRNGWTVNGGYQGGRVGQWNGHASVMTTEVKADV